MNTKKVSTSEFRKRQLKLHVMAFKPMKLLDFFGKEQVSFHFKKGGEEEGEGSDGGPRNTESLLPERQK